MRTISTLEPTRYEIAARHPDGRAFLIAYAAGSPSCRRLIDAIQTRIESIILKLGVRATDELAVSTRNRPHLTVRDWTIGYTGRTQRDVRNGGGELPFIGAAQ